MNKPSPYSEFTIKWATLEWEKAQAYQLRKEVFCDEQALFEQSDLDDIDKQSHLIVAIGGYGGWHEEIVGTVRIYQAEPGVWYGSRLAVSNEFRRQGQLGPALIKLAVCSAHAIGCKHFYAHVQQQNQRLFERMNWEKIDEMMVRQRPHVVMQADLSHYPPNFIPEKGFMVRSRSHQRIQHLAPYLLPAHIPTLQQVM